MPAQFYTFSDVLGGQALIRDEEGGPVHFDIMVYGDYGTFITVPWSYTANGSNSDLSSKVVESGGRIYRLGTVWVTESQTVTLRLEETDILGGPYTFDFYVQRGGVTPPVGGGEPLPVKAVRITEGAGTKLALPYINDEGEWKLVEAYVKHAGVWKPAT